MFSVLCNPSPSYYRHFGHLEVNYVPISRLLQPLEAAVFVMSLRFTYWHFI